MADGTYSYETRMVLEAGGASEWVPQAIPDPVEELLCGRPEATVMLGDSDGSHVEWRHVQHDDKAGKIVDGIEYSDVGEPVRLACMDPTEPHYPADGPVCGGDIVEEDKAVRFNRVRDLSAHDDGTVTVQWLIGHDGNWSGGRYACSTCGAEYAMPDAVSGQGWS